MEGAEATPARAAHAGWSGLGRFSSDPMWYPVSLYPVGDDALLVHRGKAGIISEVRRSAGGEALVDEHLFGVVVTLRERGALVGRVALRRRSNAGAELRAMGWIPGVAGNAASFECRAQASGMRRDAKAYLDVRPSELRLDIGSRPPIVVRRADGGTVEGEQTMRHVHLTLADAYRTHAHVTVGRRDPVIAQLRATGWVD
jgi:hypothetical protein